ncbi:hypothetical protein G5Y08_000010 [Vibrio parahaemolyticus]|nr:hypothetical protein [Vibrio parahaemolyticus]EHD2279003.1 hypothetical protein [Vibrio parahaemolyticus]EHH2495015.1 hypothetical protein [Vibrio parahaemolyticus]EHR0870706.1 hypothetical protein [Vibrio parahaemolyticus]EID4327252.1 hypothetical protein [Vibrio parahaemolyticus]
MTNYNQYNHDSVSVVQVHRNVDQEVIQITEDKLENILIKYAKNLGLKDSWLGPLSILITVIITLSTATFNAALGIEAAVWKALFVFVGIVSVFWLCKSLVSIFRKRKESSIRFLISKIKNAEE